MAYSLAQLQAYFKNANGGVDPTAAQNQILLSYVNQNSTNIITDAQALQSTVDLASDTTTAVSVETYQFFLGFAPSAAGLAALNKAYTGTGAQANLNGENRFIAQSVSLALQNSTAKSAFAAAYGSLSIADATTQAYNVIVGSAAASAAGINIANAVAFLTSPASIAYYTAFVKANVPGIATADIDLAVKAAIVGEILYQATVFNNGAGVGSYATVTNNLVNDLADDGVLQADNTAGIDLFGSYGVKATPQPFLLTDKADVFTGGSGDDTFTATNTTLSAADNLKGGSGNDALIYSSSGTFAVNQAGFTASGIETIQVTSDAVGGTTFDVSGTTGVAVLINDNSSSDLVLNGVNGPTALVLRNTSTPTGATTNTTINYTAAASAGSSTTQAVSLENVSNPTTGLAGAATSSITANGVEIFNVTGAGAAGSRLGALTSNTLTTVNIDGAQSVRIDNLTFATTGAGTATVDGSKNTGGINVTLSNSGAVDAVVKGGTGNDRADFSNGFAAKDSFDGGAGTDTIVLTNTTATGALGGTVTNVETLEVSGGGINTVDLSKFAGVTSVVYTSTGNAGGNSLVGTTTLNKVASTSTVTLDAGDTASAITIATGTGTDTAADATTININNVGRIVGGVNTTDNLGAITVTDIETVTINVADDASVVGTGILTTGAITAAKATKITLNSAVDVTTGAVGGAALTNLDASASTGKLDLSAGVVTSKAGATIKLGAGDDKLFVGAVTDATGGDTITLGAGKDTVVYTALAQSGDKTTDTITDFVSGTDKLDLSALGLVGSAQFLGTRANFALSQGALVVGGGVQAVFEADTNTLWIDDGSGQLDAGDFRIVLTGNTTLAATDLSLATTGNTITLAAASSVVSTTAATTPVLLRTTAEGDTINTSITNLNNSVIDGAGGPDVLVLTTAGTVAVNNGSTGGTVSNVETLTLADGTNNITFAATSALKNLNGGAGTDNVNVTNLTAGGTVNLGAGDDTATGLTEVFVETTGASISGGAGTDTATFASLTTANLDLSRVSAFETVNLTVAAGGIVMTAGKFASGVTTLTADTTAGALTANLTGAQFNTLATVTNTNGTGAFNVTFSDASTTADATSAGLTINGTGGDLDVLTFTGNGNTLSIDSVNIAKITGTVVAAGTGDTLSLTDNVTVDGAKFDAFENITLATGATTVTLNDVNVAQTITGNAANNTITFAAAQAAGDTVNISSGGNDTIQFDVAGNDTSFTTITGFSAGDVIDLNAGAVTTLTGIVTTGATVVSAATANAITNNYVLATSATQVGGALTATGDAGAVEAAIIAEGFVGAASNQFFYVTLDNGTDTGIYRVATGTVTGALDTAGEFSVTLVGILNGVSDTGTLTAGSII